MKRYILIALMIFCMSAFGSSSFDELGKNHEVLRSQLNFSNSFLTVVQNRWLSKKFLSDFSLGLSPAISGFNYLNNYSVDIRYRFFLNELWSFQLKYSRYFNAITQGGIEEVKQAGLISTELKYPQKQSYIGGLDWYPFYGKAVLYNRLVRFDLYFSFLTGALELLNQDRYVPLSSLAFGMVFWWNKNWNTRLELQGFYYKYNLTDDIGAIWEFNQYFYTMSISSGFLF